jgi:hypothetical protein
MAILALFHQPSKTGIEDKLVRILVVRIGNRREVYR